MTTLAQRRATARHRQKAAERGLTRVEVQVPKSQAALLRRLAQSLRTDPALAERISEVIGESSPEESKQTLGEFFDSLPDISGPEFDDIFELGRDRSLPEDIEL